MIHPRPTTERALEAFVGIAESLHLEFMQSTALLAKKPGGWCKEIAALATAEGGLVIFGLSQAGARGQPNVAVSVDQGVSPQQMTAETLEQMITGNVHPAIAGLEVFPVELKAAAPGRFAFVVDVPASDLAPHMVNFQYYMRHGSESLPMDDYLVRSVMARRKAPVLTLDWSVSRLPDGGPSLTFTIENVGHVGAEDIFFRVELSEAAVGQNWIPSHAPPVTWWEWITYPDERRMMISWMQTDQPTRQGSGAERRRLPRILYPSMRAEIPDFNVALSKQTPPGATMVTRLWARDMPLVEKEIFFQAVYDDPIG